MQPRVIVIGLDAATFDLIEPWSAAGHLPAISTVTRQGASGRLLSTPNMHSASAWTSILTGLNPGRHGLFVFSDRDYATGDQVFFKGGDRDGSTIVSHLNRHQLSSGLLNVPMTYPAECSSGGFAVSGLDAPSLNADAFCPAALRAELLSRFPEYSFTPKGLGRMMETGDLDGAMASWMALIETQTRAAEYLLDARPVDFFMTVYTASDWGGHNLWKYLDQADQVADKRPQPLLKIYKALDAAVERLLARAADGTQVYVISDHGMGRHSGASYHLPEWLEQKGYLSRSKRPAQSSIVGSAGQLARKWIPQTIKDRIKTQISQDRLRSLQSSEKDTFFESIDWSRTTAYSEPGRHVININLEGRNRGGTVPADKYDELCRQLIDDLSGWTDSQGRFVVDKTTRREDVYGGHHSGRSSDLFVHWNPVASVGPPPAEIRERGFWWSGDHRPEGVLICKGPGIQSGARIDNATVYDLVPTILYLAGLSVPEGLDGRVIEQACSAEFLEANKPTIAGDTASQPGGSSQLSESEEQLIEQKLRDLGYL
ncbi:MAG TPA: alkaline phosphatase family protein [Blastocatellia bacterium]|nr:alkaline phosphatase family protein [Blastocatellia bacterium]